MTDKLRCEVYHACDAVPCCSAEDECLVVAARRRYRLQNTDDLAVYNAIIQRGALMVILCCSVALAAFLALLPVEANQARLAKTYQERIVR